MLSYSTGKKKRRDWRNMVDDDQDGGGLGEQGDDGAQDAGLSGDAIDEEAIEAEFLKQEAAEEAKEAAENARLAEIKAEADARRAVREEKKRQAREQLEKQEAAKRPKVGEKKEAEAMMNGLAMSAYREKRVVVVTNVSNESTEDDIKMLFEGYGRINNVRGNHGFALVEFASDLSAEDALPIEGSKIPGPFLHNRRLGVHLRVDPTQPMPRSFGGGGGGGSNKNVGTLLPSSLRTDRAYAPEYQISGVQQQRFEQQHRKFTPSDGGGDRRDRQTSRDDHHRERDRDRDRDRDRRDRGDRGRDDRDRDRDRRDSHGSQRRVDTGYGRTQGNDRDGRW